MSTIVTEVTAATKKAIIREGISDIEKEVGKLPGAVFGDSDLCPLKHSFGDGMYMREIFIPKGVLIVGKIHKHSHPNFLMKGDVSVLTEEGSKRLKAPLSMISPAGTKRVVFAHEDTVWVTVHKTDSQNLEDIEEEVIAKDYNELNIDYIKELQLEVEQCHGEQ